MREQKVNVKKCRNNRITLSVTDTEKYTHSQAHTHSAKHLEIEHIKIRTGQRGEQIRVSSKHLTLLCNFTNATPI